MFAWRYLDEEGVETGASENFPDQAAAEEWLHTSWEALLDEGVIEVILVDGEDLDERYRMLLTE